MASTRLRSNQTHLIPLSLRSNDTITRQLIAGTGPRFGSEARACFLVKNYICMTRRLTARCEQRSFRLALCAGPLAAQRLYHWRRLR
jgi:hypothetical protein